MIGALAVIDGYNLKTDEIQTMVYLCLVKSSVSDICKSAGVQVANKMTMAMLKKLPGTVLTKITQKVGFRLLEGVKFSVSVEAIKQIFLLDSALFRNLIH